eukprot:12893129-Alexandrium_andersonii.AAC.1
MCIRDRTEAAHAPPLPETVRVRRRTGHSYQQRSPPSGCTTPEAMQKRVRDSIFSFGEGAG